MDAVIEIADVSRRETRSGNTRFVVRGDDGRELVTFRPAIGERAEQLVGQRAHIEFHEEERGEYHNVYLDAIDPISETPVAPGDVDAIAWRITAEAASHIVGDEPRSGEELFDALKPFKDRVADDIRNGRR